MRVLVLSQYFWPESFIINDIVRTLEEQGHEVVVATGKPNYPDGKIFDGYRASGTQHEHYLGRIEVLRVPLWPRGQGSAKSLILNYLSFVFSGLMCLPWMLRGREFDAILVYAPSPITQAIPAILIKWLKRAKLALWVQDQWPESLSATGFVRNPYLLRAVGWMVRAIYRPCDTLLVQSRAFVEPVAQYADRAKIQYYPNSMDVSTSKAVLPVPDELLELLEQHFCVVFAGNLGTAQALDTLVQAAVHLRDEPRIRLVLVGSGSRLAWLKAQQQALGLDNLVLPGRFPMEAMPQIFERASALLVSLSDEPAFAQTIPSKIQAYMAAGRPILACMNGEGARVVCEAQAGLASPAEQVLPLVANICSLKALDASEREAMGTSGRAYFDANFEMTSQVRRLVELLNA
ncbi:glycosyltransferase family 4 protein [Ectopseudomonas guguanensis]|jgi:glycosyltransferase involved in cell wall biosynthesis|uniref:Glycosyltransferase involved in cell wall bisynthesis n=1 Tax=Ectopseudomonas guguanensis TaxID=1198456 RepID=A0A1H0W3N4_9GAMM|nr:glycosyltransferase family 4 protein [Pseudomonas guguanensis]SDP85168.1 Glycosyltransferase involved in cell wall bisynthesis [Pseudomonas guguanensis]